MVFFVLITLALLPPQLKTNRIRIYEDDSFYVDDLKLDDNRIARIFAPNQRGEDIGEHGSILLNNVDHIAMDCMKINFQEIHKPKRILVTGLGIGVIPRALNYIPEDKSHIDVVEFGKIINFESI
jgi:hypothetical protein